MAEAPRGLQWRRRSDGSRVVYWLASRRKFKPRTQRLWAGFGEPSAAEMEGIAAECARLQEEMLYWHSHPYSKGPQRLSRSKSVVYFIAAADRVKIGLAVNVARRMAFMQTGSPVPLTLLGTMPGTRLTERQLHAKFRSAHSHGEWFTLTDALADYIAAVVREQTTAAASQHAVQCVATPDSAADEESIDREAA